ncbi:hypothetical protein MMC32_004663 [Xylographa parallela]|nr:hypothetical protein [Xylographa parallela]
MATLHLAKWVSSLQHSDLPEEVVNAVVKSYYNWAGCAVGGSQHPATTIAYNSLFPFFGKATSTLLGQEGMVLADAQHAALLNGIASHVHDYDDTHLDTIIHPAGPVASALTAVAEWKGGFSGQQFLLALAAGVEAECKLGLAVWPEHYDLGWHITSTAGSIGAAIGVSKLLNMNSSQIAHAIGIAATQVTGLREMFGSHTKAFHPGRAAQNGLMAAILASNRYTSSETALEAKRGWARVVSNAKSNVEKSLATWLGMDSANSNGLVQTNGTSSTGRWEILRNSFKPYPCGIVCHPVIDGCIQVSHMMKSEGLRVSEIEAVRTLVHPLVLELTGKTTPRDGLEAKFSVFHAGAVGLLYGKCTPTEYDDSVAQSAEVISIRNMIQAKAEKSLAADEAYINIQLKNGRHLEKHVEHAVGSLYKPMTDKQLTKKFVDQCRPILGSYTEQTSNALWAIGGASDVADVIKLL